MPEQIMDGYVNWALQQMGMPASSANGMQQNDMNTTYDVTQSRILTQSSCVEGKYNLLAMMRTHMALEVALLGK